MIPGSSSRSPCRVKAASRRPERMSWRKVEYPFTYRPFTSSPLALGHGRERPSSQDWRNEHAVTAAREVMFLKSWSARAAGRRGALRRRISTAGGRPRSRRPPDEVSALADSTSRTAGFPAPTPPSGEVEPPSCSSASTTDDLTV